MTILDRRRTQILGQMGIAIWKSRLYPDEGATGEGRPAGNRIELVEEPENIEIVDSGQFANLEEVASAVRANDAHFIEKGRMLYPGGVILPLTGCSSGKLRGGMRTCRGCPL